MRPSAARSIVSHDSFHFQVTDVEGWCVREVFFAYLFVVVHGALSNRSGLDAHVLEAFLGYLQRAAA